MRLLWVWRLCAKIQIPIFLQKPVLHALKVTPQHYNQDYGRIVAIVRSIDELRFFSKSVQAVFPCSEKCQRLFIFFVSKNPAPLLWIAALDFRVHKLGMCKFHHSMNKPFNDIQKRLGQLRIFFYDKGDILFSGDFRRLTDNGCFSCVEICVPKSGGLRYCELGHNNAQNNSVYATEVIHRLRISNAWKGFLFRGYSTLTASMKIQTTAYMGYQRTGIACL